MAQPVIECAMCMEPALIRKMTVTYQTGIDMETRETVHRRVGITYDLECPRCGYSFSLTVEDGEPELSDLPS